MLLHHLTQLQNRHTDIGELPAKIMVAKQQRQIINPEIPSWNINFKKKSEKKLLATVSESLLFVFNTVHYIIFWNPGTEEEGDNSQKQTDLSKWSKTDKGKKQRGEIKNCHEYWSCSSKFCRCSNLLKKCEPETTHSCQDLCFVCPSWGWEKAKPLKMLQELCSAHKARWQLCPEPALECLLDSASLFFVKLLES